MPIFVFVLVFLISAAAQGNAFSFQGRLNDGSNPANGSYDLQFRLIPNRRDIREARTKDYFALL